MGTFHDGDAVEPVDDVDLAYLEAVVVERVSAGRSLTVTVVDALGTHSTPRRLDATSRMRFHYDRTVPHDALDADRLAIMRAAIDGPAGLHVLRAHDA